MLRSRTKAGLLAWLAVASGLAVSIFAAALIRRSVNGSPFHLLVQPHNGQVYVQFVNPDAKLVSRRIPVALEHDDLKERRELVLDSALVPIPGGQVEFADTTLLPGRFKIRIGDTSFDVMDREIYVDGKPSGWTKMNISSGHSENGSERDAT